MGRHLTDKEAYETYLDCPDGQLKPGSYAYEHIMKEECLECSVLLLTIETMYEMLAEDKKKVQ